MERDTWIDCKPGFSANARSKALCIVGCLSFLFPVNLNAVESFVFNATQSAHVSNVGNEQSMSAGNRAVRGKLKGAEEFVLLQFDLRPIRGMTVRKVVLRLANADADLLQLGISTVAAPWFGGRSARFGLHRDGGATWAASASPDTPWAWPGSTLAHVTNGLGGSRSSAGAVKLVNGWYELDVAPRVVESVASGDQFGFLVSEHDGWRREAAWIGEQPGAVHNPYVYLKGKSGKEPVLLVSAERSDTSSPGPLRIRTLWQDNLQIGEVLLEVTASGDDGHSGRALYYEITADGRRMPSWMMIEPGAAGELQLIRLSGLPPGERVSICVVAVDEAGNRSPPVTLEAKALGKATVSFNNSPHEIKRGGPVESPSFAIWAYPDLLSLDPVTGRFQQTEAAISEGGRHGNPVWDGAERMVRLSGLRDEWIGFQLAVENRSDQPLRGLKAEWRGSDGLAVRLYREWYVKYQGRYLPDPLIALDRQRASFDLPATDNRIDEQQIQSLYVEVLIRKSAWVGVHSGVVSITDDTGLQSDIPVLINVLPGRMSRKVNYVVELNHYSFWQRDYAGARADSNGTNQRFRDLYYAHVSLAHQNRLTFNGVPYSQSGNVLRPVPVLLSGQGSDWSSFDQLYGKVLDGSAFADNHRHEQPQTHLTLAFHEAWPAHINKPGMFEHDRSRNPSYLPRFSGVFRSIVSDAGREFIHHFPRNGWDRTQLQLYLNNKSKYKRTDGSGGTSYWSLDEPRHRNDYLALSYFGGLFREAFSRHGMLPVVFRVDLSRPQFQEQLLDGVMDLAVVGNLVGHHEIVRRNADRYRGGTFADGAQGVWSYGGIHPQSRSKHAYSAEMISDYLHGSNGRVFWQALGRRDAWRSQSEDDLQVVYNPESPHAPLTSDLPVPSLRLKAMRRAQQDVELLHAAATGCELTRDQLRAVLEEFSGPGLGSRLEASTELLYGIRELLRTIQCRFQG